MAISNSQNLRKKKEKKEREEKRRGSEIKREELKESQPAFSISQEKMQMKVRGAMSLASAQIMSIFVLLLIAMTCMGQSEEVEQVRFTPVVDPIKRGAVCMDGSPAGYHYAAGSGDEAKSWLVLLMGGGWCPDTFSCQANLTTLGTARKGYANFTGILSGNQSINPDFYSWNRVWVIYCDQSSFLGDGESNTIGPKLQFRGSRVFDAVVEDLMAKGMSIGDNVILGGRSAGGLATILHCDGFRARLPNVSRVKCFSDAGFFIRAKNVPNADYREQYFASIISFHNISNFLPSTCTESIYPSLCLFPEYLVSGVKTPLFLLNSVFDYYQVRNLLVPPDNGTWLCCVDNLTSCPHGLDLIKDFGAAFFEAIKDLPSDLSRGLFIHDCFTHAVTFDLDYWSRNSTVKLGGLTISEALVKWFFDREVVTLVTSNQSPQFCS